MLTYSFTDNYHYGANDTNFNNPYDDPNGSLTTTYQWWDSARQSQVVFNPSGNGYSTSSYAYDVNGRVSSVTVADIRPRTITLVNNMDGQILERIDNGPEALDPRDVSYYFAGVKIGGVTNNGSDGVDYAEAIGNRGFTPGTGQFRNGSTYAAPFADFDQSYDILNPASDAATAGSYAVGEGDTLQAIAQAVWGDASLWYLSADANGLDGSETLVQDRVLSIPGNVINSHNSSATFRPYDPNEAIGAVSPTQPKPPPKPYQGCGIVGQIIAAIVAVVVYLWTDSTDLALVAYNLVSQGVEMASGEQDNFNWGSFAVTVASIVVGNYVQEAKWFAWLDEAWQPIANSMASNIITQGVAVATGVQDQFSWSSVAVAGITAGVTNYTSGAFAKATDYGAGTWQNQAVSIGAGLVAGEASRSLIEGTNFGDNLVSALPAAIMTLGQQASRGGGAGRCGEGPGR